MLRRPRRTLSQRVLLFPVAGLLALGLAGCGSSDEDAADTTKSEEQVATEDTSSESSAFTYGASATEIAEYLECGNPVSDADVDPEAVQLDGVVESIRCDWDGTPFTIATFADAASQQSTVELVTALAQMAGETFWIASGEGWVASVDIEADEPVATAEQQAIADSVVESIGGEAVELGAAG